MKRDRLPGGIHSRRLRLTLSLRQMMKLVIFAAAGSACVAPFARLGDMGVAHWSVVLLWGAVAVPLVLALVAFPLVRRGPLKDWLIRALLMISVGDALGYAIFLLAWIASESVKRRIPFDYSFMASIAGVIIVLGLAFIALLRKVAPRWCPDCRWPTLRPDATIPSRPGESQVQLYRCLSCQGRFVKHLGSWEAVPSGFVPTNVAPEPVESHRGVQS